MSRFDRVRNWLAEALNIDAAKITPETRLRDLFEPGSLGTIELSMHFEECFLLVDETRAASIDLDTVTVGELAELIE